MPKLPEYDLIPLVDIIVSESNVRKTEVEEGIDELAQSIKDIGLQQPVVVYKEGGKYYLLIGQRRFLACKRLRLKKIPALIQKVKNETDAKIISFSENIHRRDLNYRDKMRVAVELMRSLKSIGKVAGRLGVSSQTVRNYLGYEGVPEEIKRLVESKRLGSQTALAITKSIPDEKRAVDIAKKVIEQPSSDRKKLVIDTAKENPSKNASEIANIVKRTRFKRHITIHLTPRIAKGLEAACRDFKDEPEQIAFEALEEWLEDKGFIK